MASAEPAVAAAAAAAIPAEELVVQLSQENTQLKVENKSLNQRIKILESQADDDDGAGSDGENEKEVVLRKSGEETGQLC
jgi:hypothetical protein